MTCPQCGTLNPNNREECVRCKTRLHSEAMKNKIACANHANREATTSCAGCGIRLCEACAVNANGVDFCEADAPPSATRRSFDEDYERIPVVDGARTGRASFGARMLAAGIDTLLIAAAALVLALLYFLFGALEAIRSPRLSPTGYYLYWTLLMAGTAAYITLLTAMTGQTLGKQVAGVIVLQPDGRVLSLQASLVRFAVSAVSLLLLGLGFWWAIWDEKHETWHDKVARTAAFRFSEEA